MSFVNICEKIYRVKTALHCIFAPCVSLAHGMYGVSWHIMYCHSDISQIYWTAHTHSNTQLPSTYNAICITEIERVKSKCNLALWQGNIPTYIVWRCGFPSKRIHTYMYARMHYCNRSSFTHLVQTLTTKNTPTVSNEYNEIVQLSWHFSSSSNHKCSDCLHSIEAVILTSIFRHMSGGALSKMVTVWLEGFCEMSNEWLFGIR